MRNWPKTLRPASYKGVSFFIDEEELAHSGRFVATHAFVRGEEHATEDLGRAPRAFRLSAYLASDNADSDARDFVELCSEAGSGSLILPMLGPVTVRCTGCHLKSHRDRLGLIELDLEFVEAGTADGGGFPAVPLGDRLAAASLDQMPDATASLLADRDSAIRQDAIERRLDPVAQAGAAAALPQTTDYQGTKADAAARADAYQQLYGGRQL